MAVCYFFETARHSELFCIPLHLLRHWHSFWDKALSLALSGLLSRRGERNSVRFVFKRLGLGLHALWTEHYFLTCTLFSLPALVDTVAFFKLSPPPLSWPLLCGGVASGNLKSRCTGLVDARCFSQAAKVSRSHRQRAFVPTFLQCHHSLLGQEMCKHRASERLGLYFCASGKRFSSAK